MSYYLRYFVDDARPLTLAQLRGDLQRAAVGLELSVEGDLSSGEQVLAQVEVNSKGSDLFEDEANRFVNAVAHAAGGNGVQRRLQAARAVIAVNVLTDASDLLAPLWAWLPTYRTGLLQADGHGFYDGGRMILALA
jgi:hypothetical protein